MSTKASTGRITLKRGDGGDPTEVFNSVPETDVVPVLGVTKGQIKVSSIDSIDNHEYIAEYLGEGNDVDIEWNYIIGNAEQEGIITDVTNGINRNYEMTVSDGVKTIASIFTLTPISWNRKPSFTEQHKLTARFKISGAITDVVTP